MKSFLHKLTNSELSQIKAYMSKDIRLQQIYKNYAKHGQLNVLEKIIVNQLLSEYCKGIA